MSDPNMATTAAELATSSSLVDSSAMETTTVAEFASSSSLLDASAMVAPTAADISSPLVDASTIAATTTSELATSSPLVDASAIAATTAAELPTSSSFVDASPIVAVAPIELHHRSMIESEVEESGVSEEQPLTAKKEEENGLAIRAEDEQQAMSKSGKRRLQHVSTKKAQKKVLMWMIKEVETSNTDKNIVSKAVKEFPMEFRSQSKANLQKASRWWKHREEFLELVSKTSEVLSLSAKQNGTNSKQVRTKALNGRGRKREPWVEWLHNELIDEFVRLKKASVKLSSRLLLTFARGILEKSEHPDFHQNAVAKDGVKLPLKLTPRWIQCFQERFDISLRR